MPTIANPLRVPVALASSNGRYEGRWPAGDRPAPPVVLTGSASALATVIVASLTTGGGGSLPYPTPNTSTDKFVSASAAGSGDGSFASPWTLTQAIAGLTAGQKCWLRAGTYTPPTTWSSNSGSSGSPIEMLAYPSEFVRLDLQAASSANGSNIEKSYWNFWGIDLKAGARGLTGFTSANHHVNFYYCSGTKNALYNDNCGIVMFDQGAGNGTQIYLCDFSSAVTGGNNEALIYISQLTDFDIAGNRLTGSQHPIYQKHDYGSSASPSAHARKIRNNIIKDAEVSVWVNFVGTQVFDNLLINSDLFNDINGGPSSAQDFDMHHNTHYNGQIIWYSASTGSKFRDSILAGNCRIATPNGAPSTIGFEQHDYNQFQAGASRSPFYPFFSSQTFAQWKSANPTFDAHSNQADVTFSAGWSSSSVTPAHWAITAPSSALTGSSTGGLRGCDTTKLLTVD